jgi:hypothetical protein
MAVYVDDMRLQARVGRITARWSHLHADSVDELHGFAQRIGLKRAWFQDKPGFAHYDVTDTKRREAIRAGAKSITYREMATRRDRGLARHQAEQTRRLF